MVQSRRRIKCYQSRICKIDMETYPVINRRSLPESGWNSLSVLCFLLIGIRLIFTGIMGIMPQDAYYDFYAQHLDLSYYDHPPMIAYLLTIIYKLCLEKKY